MRKLAEQREAAEAAAALNPPDPEDEEELVIGINPLISIKPNQT